MATTDSSSDEHNISIRTADVVLMDQTSFLLPHGQWEEFCKRIDEPAKVIPLLQQLFSEQDPF